MDTPTHDAYTLDDLHLIKEVTNDDKPYAVWGDGINLIHFKTAQEALDFLGETYPEGYKAKIIV